MPVELLAETNPCGQKLLQLVSAGNAIVAELLRLTEFIAPAFRSDRQQPNPYAGVISDFSYFSNSDAFEKRIESSVQLQDLDEELRENHIEILSRFYFLFESIYKYVTNLNRLVEELEEGVFIQQTLESIFLDPDGKQLMAEALYLYGVMLLTLDRRIDGSIRERMLVSYYRYSSESTSAVESGIDDVCRLLRSTGYAHAAHPPNYPESYFARVPLDKKYVSMVIGKLRSDDLYCQIPAYPLPEHRSTALATQSAMLYVCLFFAPDLLHNQTAVMREIVDRFFPDNWVVNIYMGMIDNLVESWDPYRAAKQALLNSLESSNVKAVAVRHGEEMSRLNAGLKQFLQEGTITSEFILENSNKMMNTVRKCNATLRWLMLHTTVLSKAKLQAWFKNLSEQVSTLEFKDTVVTGKKTIQFIKALEEIGLQSVRQRNVQVQEFHNLDSQLGIRQFLDETRNGLHKMHRIINLQDECLVHLQIIGDSSYLWQIIDNYTDLMQHGMKKDPFLAIKLRAAFLKLCSALDLPLLRISQCGSSDLISVSQYYSSELVLYVRKVLQVIPDTVFALLSKIIEIQTSSVVEVPTRLDKDKMKDYAQLDARYEVARLTHAISVLTEGILAMKTTLVGTIKVDPKRLLEDGVRKELVRLVATAMHNTLQFSTSAKNKPSEVVPVLNALAKKIDGFKRSFEYISDYISMFGLKIWQEEFSRIINYYVEQECNMVSKQKVQDFESTYQSRAIPIPSFPPTDNQCQNFIGRLAREIERVVDTKSTVYVHELGCWYDSKTKKEVANPQLWTVLTASIGNIGCSGLDRLYCFKIRNCIESLSNFFNRNVLAQPEWQEFLSHCRAMLSSTDTMKGTAAKFISSLSGRMSKVQGPVMDLLLRVGQLQILRLHIVHELYSACKFQSKLLQSALETMNSALLSELVLKDPPASGAEATNMLLYELTAYLEAAGMTDSLTKVYCDLSYHNFYVEFLALLVLSHINKLAYIKNIGLLSKRPQDGIDGTPFVVGVLTVLLQYDPSKLHSFVQSLAVVTNSLVMTSSQASDPKVRDLPSEVGTLLAFLNEIERFQKGIISPVLSKHLPEYLRTQLGGFQA